MTLANLSILKTGKARAIRFSTLEAICDALQCQPGDLLEYERAGVADEDAPVAGILVCYFVLTAWVAARRRDGATGWFEKIACAAALGTGALMMWGAFT